MSILTDEESRKLIAMPSDEFDTMMCKEFPEIFIHRNAPMTETCMCWGFSCEPGWQPLLFKLCQQIDLVSSRLGIFVRANQVKEKYASLRFYWSGEVRPESLIPDNKFDIAYDIVEALVSNAEHTSSSTCEVCGEYGNGRRIGGWIRTLCDTHAEEETKLKASLQV